MGDGSELTEARACARESARLRAEGDLEHALGQSYEALDLFRTAGSASGEASAHRLIGSILADMGHYYDASEAFDAARAVCIGAGQVAAAAVCAVEAGRSLRAAGDAPQATRFFATARAMYDSLGDDANVAENDRRIAELRSIPTAAVSDAPNTARRRLVVAGVTAVLVLVVGVVVYQATRDSTPARKAGAASSSTDTKASGQTAASTTASTTTTPAEPIAPSTEPGIYADPAWFGKVYPGKTNAMVAFRGNPSRSYYGRGPVPKNPHLLWQYPKTDPMCLSSTDKGYTSTWCGMGWTGQVNVFKLGNAWALGFGAYDGAHHVVDAATGTDLLKGYYGTDLAKGSVTADPDGYPLMYGGSRDNNFRVYAMDRDTKKLTVLWSTNSHDISPILWNDDWDGSPLVLNDYLIEGSENSQWYIIKLNRGYDASGKVTVDPKIIFHAPGWDQQELDDIVANGFNDGPEVSIENSVAVYKHTVYFANSGGLVQGWDTTGIENGVAPKRIFRFWTGEDTDASVVVDEQGMLYVNTEGERHNNRSKKVGHLMKLDPSKWTSANPDAAIVWSFAGDSFDGNKDGFWSTPAIYGNLLIAGRTRGQLYAFDRTTGAEVWKKQLPAPTDQSMWASPVVVDKTLIQADCVGQLHAFDLSNPGVDPPELWSVKVPSDSHCIETTPTVFDGKIYLGSRNGYLYAFGD